jgi:toxin ParE1/3/4
MAGRWRLTRRAKASLAEIALWTVTTFGVRQAQTYEEDLIAKCRAIADRTAMGQSCQALVDRPDVSDLRFSRVGQHFVIFIERPDGVAILDFVHARSDLPRKLLLLQARRQG